MTLHEEIELAYSVCSYAHDGQFRRDGITPYATHPIHVSSMVPDELKPAALLHDVPEDTGTTYEDLVQMGFSTRTTNAVLRLTRLDNESYDEYIKSILESSDSIKIKIADMEHNLSCDPSENSKKKIARWLPMLKAALEKEQHVCQTNNGSSPDAPVVS